MFKYLKSDLYVASKMKATYILPIIALLLIFMNCFLYLRVNFTAFLGEAYTQDVMSSIENTSEEPMSEQMSQSFSMGFNHGYVASSEALEEGEDEEEPEYKAPTLGDIFSGGMLYEEPVSALAVLNLRSSTGILLVSIFGVFLFANWLRGGLSKNILKGNSNRFVPYFSKVITLFIYTVAFNVFQVLVTALFVAMMGKNFELGLNAEFWGFFGLNTLMTFAFACLVVMITTLSKSTALGMDFAIICGTGALQMVIILLELLINHVILDNGKVSIAEHLLSGIVQNYTPDSPKKMIITALVMSAVYLVVSLGVGSFVYRKRDIH